MRMLQHSSLKPKVHHNNEKKKKRQIESNSPFMMEEVRENPTSF